MLYLVPKFLSIPTPHCLLSNTAPWTPTKSSLCLHAIFPFLLRHSFETKDLVADSKLRMYALAEKSMSVLSLFQVKAGDPLAMLLSRVVWYWICFASYSPTLIVLSLNNLLSNTQAPCALSARCYQKSWRYFCYRGAKSRWVILHLCDNSAQAWATQARLVLSKSSRPLAWCWWTLPSLALTPVIAGLDWHSRLWDIILHVEHFLYM